MSKKHPIIAVTGSSGAGTTSVKLAFEHLFRREEITACVVEGDSFHRYNRAEMREAVAAAVADGCDLSHFGPDANLFAELEALFREYGGAGSGKRRLYLHNEDEAAPYAQQAGTFTAWEPIPAGSDLLFYEGLHGAVVTDSVNVAQYPDLLVGVVPVVNLEWIQKIHRDSTGRGYDPRDVTANILRRMPDYVNFITPQFSLTDVNFQRVPLVDTSNPFVARDVPNSEESFVVIRFKDPRKFDVDFPYLLSMLHDSFMTRRNTLVAPGGKMGLAMELIFGPIIERMLEERRRALR